MNGILANAIKQARASGNYDGLIAIATAANTPEAQRLLREAVEREAAEDRRFREWYQQFRRDAVRNFWG
jgi:hypothetical protein